MTRQKRRQQMGALVARWHAGTETQEAFARRHGLSRAALQYWVRRMAAASPASPVAFAPVRVLAPAASVEAGIAIVLVGGERVVVPPHTSADQLRVVLSVLRPSC
jgi:hypothetical protein